MSRTVWPWPDIMTTIARRIRTGSLLLWVLSSRRRHTRYWRDWSSDVCSSDLWALAMRFRADYARADVPMLPVVAGPLSVGRQTVAWTWLTVAVSLLLWPVAGGFGSGWVDRKSVV